MNGDHVQRLDDAAVHALALPQHVERSLMANLAVFRTLRVEIASFDTILYQEVKLRAEFQILKTTPEIGDVLAATIMLETGIIKRFPRVGHSAPIAGASSASGYLTGRKRAKECKARQQVSCLGVHRGPGGGTALLPAGATLL
jgi:transposase